MINQWMTPKDITEIEGMPGSIQGVHKKAKREGWLSRKREGVQGPGIEYQIPTPADQNEIEIKQDNSGTNDFLEVWQLLLTRLTPEEKSDLLDHAITNGVSSLLPNEYTQRALSIAQLIETLSDDDQREILHLIEIKKLGALLDNTKEQRKA